MIKLIEKLFLNILCGMSMLHKQEMTFCRVFFYLS